MWVIPSCFTLSFTSGYGDISLNINRNETGIVAWNMRRAPLKASVDCGPVLPSSSCSASFPAIRLCLTWLSFQLLMSAKFHWLHWAGLDRSSSSEAESSVLGVQNRKMFLHAKAKEIKQKLVVVDRQVCYEWKCEQTG